MRSHRGARFLLDVLIAIVGGLAIPGCATTPIPATLTPQEKEVATVIQRWDAVDKFEKADINAVADLLTDDVIIESFRLSKTLHKSDYLAMTEAKLKRQDIIQALTSIEIHSLDVKLLSADKAETVEKFTVLYKRVADQKVWVHDFITESKLRLENGAWRIYHEKTYMTR